MRGQGEVRPLPKNERATPAKPREPGRAPDDLGAPSHFHHPVAEEPMLGHVPGLRQGQLRRLRAGKLRPEAAVDLHGLDRAGARERLWREIGAASRAGRRCVLVIHGRGLRSEGGEPVLKQALPSWLAEPRLRGLVLAFCPARPQDGGPGASYVLLRDDGDSRG